LKAIWGGMTPLVDYLSRFGYAAVYAARPF